MFDGGDAAIGQCVLNACDRSTSSKIPTKSHGC